MPVEARISAGILNVRLHPHPEGVYKDFIEALYKLKKPVKIWGDRWGMISLLSKPDEESGVVSGLITTFTKIDMDQPWFDAQNLEEASSEALSEIDLPSNLFPNASTFNFVFDTDKHKLYIQTRSRRNRLSINLANTLFQKLSDDLKITTRFGQAAIDVVQSKMGLERIFSLKVLKKVKLIINKPNADVFDDDFDENIEKYMLETHMKRMEMEFTAESGQSIAPNDSLKRVGESALEHGVVIGEGRDADGPVTRSSKEFPRQIVGSFDPNSEQENLAFRQMIGR